jgi:hypothetical protein
MVPERDGLSIDPEPDPAIRTAAVNGDGQGERQMKRLIAFAEGPYLNDDLFGRSIEKVALLLSNANSDLVAGVCAKSRLRTNDKTLYRRLTDKSAIPHPSVLLLQSRQGRYRVLGLWIRNQEIFSGRQPGRRGYPVGPPAYRPSFRPRGTVKLFFPFGERSVNQMRSSCR